MGDKKEGVRKGVVWNRQMEITGEMQYLEGGWAYTGFCRAVHPAGVSLKFIKSSKCQTRGRGRSSHSLRHVWGKRSTQDGGTEVAVLERPNRSLLVRGETGQPKYVRVCVFVCAFECVSGQCCCLRLQVEEGKREGRASGCEECSQRFGCSTVTEQSHRTAASVMAHSFRCGMPLENSPMHAFHARVYVWVWVNLRKLFDLFIPSLSLNSLKRCDS